MMRPPKRRSEVLRKPDDGPIHLTEDGFERLKARLERFKRAVPDLAAEAARTAAYGDRSDNAEYKLAKSALRRANWQILSIQDQLKRVVIIAHGADAAGKVQIGSEVVLEAVDAAGSTGSAVSGAKKIYRILGSQETDPTRGRISFQSPLGAALIGRAKGDVVTVQVGDGERKYLIREVL